MNDDDHAARSREEFGEWLTRLGAYATAVGSRMQRDEFDWAELKPRTDMQWLQLADDLGAEQTARLADVLTVLTLSKQPIRDDQRHPLAEYVAQHDDPAMLLTGLVMLIQHQPHVVTMPTEELQSGLTTLRAAAA